MTIENKINALYDKTSAFNENDLQTFQEFKSLLNTGSIRAAQKVNNEWKTNIWVKKGILIGFKMGKIVSMNWSPQKPFVDKDTFPEYNYHTLNNVRIVPGGTSIRDGSYIGSGVTIMPPSFVNVGAYIDDGTMLDSHSLVGSCAQVGKNVHISAAAMVGGVIEPIGNNPVIIEDGAFIGGNCGIYEGVVISEKAIIAAGVVITASTKVYDMVNDCYLASSENKPLIIPPQSVVISGTRQVKGYKGISIYCPVIIKYRDSKTELSVKLEEILR